MGIGGPSVADMRELVFRGSKQNKNYFEGWYFRFVDIENDLIIILIPGLSFFKERMAFLQYIVHHRSEVFNGFLKYEVEDFEIAEPFCLTLPHGLISKDRVELKLDFMNLELSMGDFIPLKTSLMKPSIMGFFEYLRMPCYHDVISMNHEVTGSVRLKGEDINFRGRGYIEGDRGMSFPEYYIWAQCNHFTNPTSSLFLSVADINTPLFQFLGHIAVFHHEGREYRFASYLGSRAEVSVSGDKTLAHVSFQNRRHRLSLDLNLKPGNSLIAPMKDNMNFKIKEQVKSEIELDFDGYKDSSSFCASELVNWRTT